jgi:predicted Zn-dependent protease
MNTAVLFTRRILLLSLFCGPLVAGTACPQWSDDPLDGIRALHASDQFEESLEDLRALMDEDPTDPEVNYLLGKALMSIGEPSLAIWPLRRAVEYPEYGFEAGMLLAWATIDSRTSEDAIGAVDIALAAQPHNVDALALRAHANVKADRYADAWVDVERAVALDPDHPAILVPRVLVLLEFERIDEAEAALDAGKRALETVENQLDEEIQARLCLTNAAFAFEDGDRKSAEVMYADCLAAYPTQKLTVLQAVEFYDAIGQQERATALLRRTFEETRETYFGYELSRRVRRLGEKERSVSKSPGEA